MMHRAYNVKYEIEFHYIYYLIFIFIIKPNSLKSDLKIVTFFCHILYKMRFTPHSKHSRSSLQRPQREFLVLNDLKEYRTIIL